ncbi:MAG: hypothetical protein LBM66_06265 [Bifidobacteriaceae bacterium]|jgi:hypothetical protein|nr:hypothetical protein [Bifidobacteriaceae bacterium]
MTPRRQVAYAAPATGHRRGLPDIPASVSPRYSDAGLRDLLDGARAEFDSGSAGDLPVTEAMAEIRASLNL